MVEEPATHDETEPAAQQPAARDAILFVPGLSDQTTDQSVNGVARRLAAAMDRHAETARAKFRVGEVREKDFGGSAPVRTTTIHREDDGREQPIADVYRVDYRDLFLEKYRDAMPWVTILRVVLALVPVSARLLISVRNGIMTLKEKLQVALAFMLIALLGVYLVVLVGALVATGAELWRDETPTVERERPAEEAEEGEEGVVAWVVEKKGALVTFFALLLPALGFTLPTSTELRQRLTEIAILVMALIFYFQAGERRRVLSGWLHTVLQRLQELDDVEYARIHVVGYSFGSIVALDTLFPDRESVDSPAERIDSLVTIGSPFNFVQLFWPRYFRDRRAPEELRWFNVYAPEDVLSSNFRTYSKAESAAREGAESSVADSAIDWIAPPQNVKYRLRMGRDALSWWDPFLFVGMRSHSMYWEPGDVPQVNVFDAAVSRIYAGDPVLG